MSETNEALSLTELPAVARNIHLMCKKCGVERFHVVVAHTTATSAKVKCEVCGASSTFKLKKAKVVKKSASGTVKKRATKKSEPDSKVVWGELKTQIGTDKIVPYSMKTKYTLANAIEHPKFGLGFVTAATNEKIEVMFQEGGRALVHNRT
jgi:MinD superfamily P-loop ATPase